MNDERLQIGGAVIFWKLAKGTHCYRCRQGLAAMDLEQFAPEKRSFASALRAAMEDVYPAPRGSKYSVRPIENGFAVVADDAKFAKPGDPWGKVIARATFSPSEEVTLDPWDPDRAHQLASSISSVREWFSSAAVAKSLVSLIEHFGGVPLRPNGAIYWLKQEHLERWTSVAAVFEAASGGHMPGDDSDKKSEPTKVHMLRVVADEQMVVAVGDALSEEIESACREIEAELSTGTLGERACENRLQKSNALLQKVRRYEEAFGKPMATLTDAIQRAGTAIAMATLQQSASNAQATFAFLQQ